MKKILLMAALVFGMGIYGCGGNKSEQTAKADSAEVATEVLSVDYVLSHADSLVGKTVEVEGVCSHLCKHGARKAFLTSDSSEVMLRAEATGDIDSFPKAAIHNVVRIKGVVVEDRVDEKAIQAMEKQYQKAMTAHGENAEVGCNAEKAAQGQKKIDTFAARMKDYRDKIAARQAKEGNAYLSFYHLDAQSYTIEADSVK